MLKRQYKVIEQRTSSFSSRDLKPLMVGNMIPTLQGRGSFSLSIDCRD